MDDGGVEPDVVAVGKITELDKVFTRFSTTDLFIKQPRCPGLLIQTLKPYEYDFKFADIFGFESRESP